MKVIVAGGRDFNSFSLLSSKLDFFLKDLNKEDIEIVSGKAKGADTLGERYAKERGLKIKEFPADWNTFGKMAGPRRNTEMANYADCLVAFWDGESKGTDHMIWTANNLGLKVRVVRYKRIKPGS